MTCLREEDLFKRFQEWLLYVERNCPEEDKSQVIEQGYIELQDLFKEQNSQLVLNQEYFGPNSKKLKNIFVDYMKVENA